MAPPPDATPDATPLTAEQAGVWFTEEMGLAGAVYHLPLTVDFDGPLDVDALRAACAAVVRRYPVLARAVHVAAGAPFLVPAPAPELPVVDLTDAPGTVDRVTAEETARAFDRAVGPLVRFTLLRRAPDRHRLVVVAHHLVFDGASKSLLLDALARAYRAEPQDAAPSGPPSEPEDGADDAARRYWPDRWRPPEPLVLPGEQARTVEDGPDGVTTAVRLDLDDLARPLQRASVRLRATRFELLLTALRCVLLRYGNARATVAVDLDTRTADTRDEIGMWVTQLPVDGGLDARADFPAAVAATRAALRELHAVRRTPLSRVVAVRAGTALAPVSMSYRRRDPDPAWPAPLRATVDWAPLVSAAPAPLHLQVVDDGTDGIAAIVQHRSAGPDPDRGVVADVAAAVAGHLRTLLDGVLAAPDVPVARLPLLTGDERRAVEGRGGTTPYPDTTVDRLLAEQARRTPDTVAVEADDGRCLTYAELDAAAAGLADVLRRAGAGPGVPVGVLAHRCLELVVGALAVQKAGAVYFPLDPDLPAARLHFLVADARAPIVLAADEPPPLPDGVRVLALDHPAADGAVEDTGTRPDDPAYLIYTSGSTGVPKGVLNSHRGLVNFLDAMQRRFRLGVDDVVLQKTPIGFDVSLSELFWPLAVGARLVIARPDGHRDPRYLRQVIVERGVTTINFVPSMLAAFVDEPGAPPCPGLRRTICIGEELRPDLAARFLAALPGELHNLYGPAEAAIVVSAWAATRDDVDGAVRLPIGRPLQNLRLTVLDAVDEPAPVGIVGELAIGGTGVALRYHDRPGLTADRFEPDPAGADGARRYRTGDLARLRADGLLEYFGRTDRQVKLRGHRVEPGEVEAALVEHPAVRRAAVLVDRSGADGGRLVACVTTDGSAGPELAAELRERLAARLPDHLVPARVLTVDRLPVNANGKLDTAELAALVAAAPVEPTVEPDTPDDARDDELATQVTAIWADALGVATLGVHDDLFDLGGHSLTVTRIAARMRQELSIDLPLHVFFDNPTVAEVLACT